MAEPLTLLCVHPHPDDESIACGGVLARAADQGHRTVVVTCTGGEEGENLAGIDLGGVSLAEHRRRELAAALQVLGVRAHHWLGYRDSGMAGTPANDHPASFHRAEPRVAAGRLAAIIRAERPAVVVSDAADGSYGHPDHVRAHQVTRLAVALAADPTAPVTGAPWRVDKRYVHTLATSRLARLHAALREAGLASPFGAGPEPDAALSPGTPDDLVTTLVDVGPWLQRKQRAMAAHRSQIGPDSFFLNVPADRVAELLAQESFVLEEGGPPPGRRETDLFEGVAPRG